VTEELRHIIFVYAKVSSHSHVNILLITSERRRGSAGHVLLNRLYDVLLADKVQSLRKWRFTSAGGYEHGGGGGRKRHSRHP
jgi:hypothetical protein